MTVNVSDYLRDRAAGSGEQVALVEAYGDGRRVTWSELDAQADGVARWLSQRGLVAGHRAGLCLRNRVELVAAYFGILRAGLVAVPVNPRSAMGELVRTIADSGMRTLFCDDGTVDAVRHAVENVEAALAGSDEDVRARAVAPDLVVTGAAVGPAETAYESLTSTHETQVPPRPSDPEMLALLLYTSGTSGQPRGVMLTHRALSANVEQIAAIEPPVIGPHDVVLGVLPLFHIYGLGPVLTQVVRQGARLVLVDRFEADRTLDVVAEHAVTNLPVAPPIVAVWAGRSDLREKLASVRLVLSGAAPLAPELGALFADSAGTPVEQGYGLTETAPVLTATLAARRRGPDEPPKPGSVGAPLRDVEIRVAEDTGEDADEGDPGQIVVRGPNLFSGFWPDGADGPDPDGWYATGDVGILDGDGDLTLVDRLRELVIVSGFNVYPFEVEDVVTELPEVAEAAVIAAPDPVTGEAVQVFVVPAAAQDDAVPSEARLGEAVRAHCEARLARYKWPRDVTVVTELPHVATGKVAKQRLRAQHRREALGL